MSNVKDEMARERARWQVGALTHCSHFHCSDLEATAAQSLQGAMAGAHSARLPLSRTLAAICYGLADNTADLITNRLSTTQLYTYLGGTGEGG